MDDMENRTSSDGLSQCSGLEFHILCENLCLSAAQSMPAFYPEKGNPFGAFLVDVGNYYDLLAMAQHLRKSMKAKACFHFEGSTDIIELPKATDVKHLAFQLRFTVHHARIFKPFRGIVIVDLSAVTDTEHPSFQSFLEDVAEFRNNIVFMFRTDPRQPAQYAQMLRVIAPVIHVYGAHVSSSDAEQYEACLKSQLLHLGLSIAPDAEPKLMTALSAVCNGHSFRGESTVGQLARGIRSRHSVKATGRVTRGDLDAYMAGKHFDRLSRTNWLQPPLPSRVPIWEEKVLRIEDGADARKGETFPTFSRKPITRAPSEGVPKGEDPVVEMFIARVDQLLAKLAGRGAVTEAGTLVQESEMTALDRWRSKNELLFENLRAMLAEQAKKEEEPAHDDE